VARPRERGGSGTRTLAAASNAGGRLLVHADVAAPGKYRLTPLANPGAAPADWAVVVVVPLKLVDGTGTPTRVLALV
jgi:kynurenine formamidase